MGAEPWVTFVSAVRYDERSTPIIESQRVVEACRARGIAAARLFGRREIVLAEGS